MAPAHHSPLPRRPLTGLALTVAAGVGVGLAWPSPHHALLAGSALLAAAVWAQARAGRTRLRQRVATLLLHAALCALAAASAAIETRRREAAEKPFLAAVGQPGTTAFRGYVASDPSGQSLAHGGARLRFLLHAQPADGHSGPRLAVWVDWYGSRAMLGPSPSAPNPLFGQGWELEGRLRTLPRRRPSAPALALAVRPGQSRRMPSADAPRWMRWLGSLRTAASQRLGVGIGGSPHGSGVLRAMLLGSREELTPALRQTFARSGTVHIFAISGLHVGLLAALLVYILPMTRIPRPSWIWFLAPVLIGYTLLTGARPSAQRACIMSLLFFGAPLMDRRPDALSALSAAGALLLLLNPLQLTELGFVFSFVCVLGILLLSGPLFQRWQPQPADEAPRSAERLLQEALMAGRDLSASQSKAPWREALHTRLAGMLALSAATWLVSTPLTATYFGRVVPIALFSNLVAIPLAFGIVLCGILSLVTGAFWTLPAALFNSAALVLIETLLLITRLAARLPGAWFETGRWPPWLTGLWYLGCLALAVRLRRPRGPSRRAPKRDGVEQRVR